MKRRQSLKFLSSIPLLAVFPSLALAADKKKDKSKAAPAKGKSKQAKNLLDPNDTLAKAMQYKHDASKAGPVRSNKKAFCYNCSKYNVCMEGDKSCKPLSAAELKKSEVAPCQIFKGKVVKKNGWCLSWQAKG